MAELLPYSYTWSNGQSGSSQLSGLTVGVYTATVTDANGCSFKFTGQITSPAQIKPLTVLLIILHVMDMIMEW